MAPRDPRTGESDSRVNIEKFTPFARVEPGFADFRGPQAARGGGRPMFGESPNAPIDDTRRLRLLDNRLSFSGTSGGKLLRDDVAGSRIDPSYRDNGLKWGMEGCFLCHYGSTYNSE
jgi:hypothetical protein